MNPTTGSTSGSDVNGELTYRQAPAGLAPQYPFPCALHDALASYLFLIDPPADGSVAHEPVPPENIILSGDSAGGGLALSVRRKLAPAMEETGAEADEPE